MDDVRTLDAAVRRRRWAAQQVRRARIRHGLRRAGAAIDRSTAVTAVTAAAVHRLGVAYLDLDLDIEVDRMWEDA